MATSTLNQSQRENLAATDGLGNRDFATQAGKEVRITWVGNPIEVMAVESRDGDEWVSADPSSGVLVIWSIGHPASYPWYLCGSNGLDARLRSLGYEVEKNCGHPA